MSVVTAHIDIDAPPEKVWEVVMDPDRFPDWVTIHRRVDHAEPGPPRRGMKLDQTLCLRHTNFKVHWTLAECHGPRHATWEGRGPMHSSARTAYTLSRNGDGGTHFEYENEFKAPGGPLGKAASRLIVGGLPEKEAKASLQRLKALLESQ